MTTIIGSFMLILSVFHFFPTKRHKIFNGQTTSFMIHANLSKLPEILEDLEAIPLEEISWSYLKIDVKKKVPIEVFTIGFSNVKEDCHQIMYKKIKQIIRTSINRR